MDDCTTHYSLSSNHYESCHLTSSSSTLDLQSYSNSDWVGDINDCHSTGGFSIFFYHLFYILESKKQDSVSCSVEAEICSQAHTIDRDSMAPALTALRYMREQFLIHFAILQ